MTWTRMLWMVALSSTLLACGGSEFDNTGALELDTQEQEAVASGDPIARGFYTKDANKSFMIVFVPAETRVHAGGGTCWPNDTHYWSNVTYWYTDSTGNRFYKAQRRKNGICDSTLLNVTLVLKAPYQTQIEERNGCNCENWTYYPIG